MNKIVLNLAKKVDICQKINSIIRFIKTKGFVCYVNKYFQQKFIVIMFNLVITNYLLMSSVTTIIECTRVRRNEDAIKTKAGLILFFTIIAFI